MYVIKIGIVSIYDLLLGLFGREMLGFILFLF